MKSEILIYILSMSIILYGCIKFINMFEMTEKEKEKIYSKMHQESNLSDNIIGIFICSVIIYFLLKLIECIFYGNIFST